MRCNALIRIRIFSIMLILKQCPEENPLRDNSIKPPPTKRGASYWEAEYERMMDIFCFTFVFLLMVFAFAVIAFAALPWVLHYWMDGGEE